MKPLRTKRSIQSLGVLAITTLALTACGGNTQAPGTDDSTGSNTAAEQPYSATFDFTEESIRDMPSTGVQELKITIPQNLEQTADEYREHKMAQDITVTATEPVEATANENCAIQAHEAFTQKTIDEVYNGNWYIDLSSNINNEQELQEFDVTSNDLDSDGHLLLSGDQLHSYLLGSNPNQDEQIREEGVAKHVYNTKCATSPNEGSTVEIRLRQLNSHHLDSDKRVRQSDELFTENFATVELRVMNNGDLHIAEYDVNDYAQDSNGDWIAQ